MMHPVLARFGDFALHTYGVFAAIGFVAGMALAAAAAPRAGVEKTTVQDAGLPLLLGGLLGARLFYVLFHGAEFAAAPWDVLKVWRGGLMWQGGLLGGVLAGAVFFRRRKIRLGTAADLLAPGVALGQAFGRLGCFFAGCCYGAACRAPWAVTFHDPESLAPRGVPLHPTQLYDAAANFLIAALLWAWGRQGGLAAGRGRLAFAYLALASAARLGMEAFRDDARGVVGPFSATAVFASVLFLLGVAGLAWRRTA
ncbi:MAG: prolipoprotein diacylglyceryl transferase [Elusimicrobia bacterium]|jgi:phosphatidylglycerol:prolipoprotein diacylglycerol transferase|nr:MAG: prolipoprotein diacylglyceryl transferase [Elusimicrobiota bacterium]